MIDPTADPARRPVSPEPGGPADDPAQPVGDPPPYTEPPRSTGTVDDDDEPEDEHDGENEASVRGPDDRLNP